MLNLSVESDIKKLADKLAGTFSERRFNSVIASAMTATIAEARIAIAVRMLDVFQGPTPYTMNSTFVKRATANDLTAFVGIKGKGAIGGVSIKPYLTAEIYGNQREQKKFERLLSDQGYLTAGWILTPASGVKLNQYGNVNGATYKAIISGLANPDSGIFAITNDTKGGRKLKAGIWKRTPNGLSMLFAAHPRALYKVRLNLLEVVRASYDKHFPRLLEYYTDESLKRLIARDG